MMRWPRQLIISVACALVIGGCESKTMRSAPVGWRTEIAPVKKRFAKIDSIEAVYWKGGTVAKNSSQLVPGPSDFYFRGFIVVDEAEFISLVRQFEWQPCTSGVLPQEFPTDLGTNTEYLRSGSFEKSYMPRGWHGVIVISQQSPVIYFDILKSDAVVNQ